MRTLITGGAGFIGSHLAERLLGRGDQVLAIDNFVTGRRDTVAGWGDRLPVLDGDIADGALVERAFAQHRPEVVVHCAASYRDPDDWTTDVHTNALGTATIVQAARRHGARRLLYLQTALCYGSRPLEHPITTAHPLRPDNSYAISKTAGERFVLSGGVPALSFRLANMYGPRNLSGPIAAFYSRLRDRRPCFVVDTRRDFVFVDDLVDVLEAAVDGIGEPGVYHVASGRDYAIRDLYDAVAGAMDRTEPAELRQRGSDDAATIMLDASQTYAVFGWKPRTPLEDGVRRAIAWYEQHGVTQTFTHLRAPEGQRR
jgi:UDP-glucose 4-epimerase